MIRYGVLGSGSSGNSYMIQSGESAVMFDAGFSVRQLQQRAESASMEFGAIQALCITHLHPDHCRAAGVFARKTGKPIYIHKKIVEGSFPELEKLGIPSGQLYLFDSLEPFSIGPFTITAFPTSHDSPSPVGFHLESEGRRFTLLTDTGRLDEIMSRFALQADILFLEANYDEPMLDNGPYPIWLKKRIRGESGHLSNTDAIGLLNSCRTDVPTQVYFCHISKTNNRPEILESLCTKYLKWGGKRVVCAHGEVYSGSLDPRELCS